jgi:hypothetical protein
VAPPQRYTDDKRLLLEVPIEDGVVRFTGRRAAPMVPAAAAG